MPNDVNNKTGELDARWRQGICLGNKAFEAGKLDAALQHYVATTATAEEMFRSILEGQKDPGGQPVPSMAVSAINTAQVWKRMEEYSRATTVLQTVSNLFCNIMRDRGMPMQVRLDCVQNSPRIVAELVSVMRLSGSNDDEVSSQIARTKEAADACFSDLKTLSCTWRKTASSNPADGIDLQHSCGDEPDWPSA